VRDRTTWGVAAFTILAALLRFSSLGAQSFWSDEAVTTLLVRMEFRDMLELIPESESTPPLYYAVAWPWAQVFGSDEIGLRSLSALAGTAAVPLAAVAAWRLVSRRAAVVTSALVAVNPLLVWYSQEARAYSLLVALVSLSFLAFVLARERSTWPRLAFWAASAVLAGLTHYFAAFVVVPQAVFLLATRRRAMLVPVGAVALSALMLAPLALAQRGTGSAEWISRSALDERLITSAKQLLVGRSGPADRQLAFLAAALVLVSIVLLIRSSDRHARGGAAVAATVGLSALALPVGLTVIGLDYVIAQNVLPALTPLLVALAAGFAVGEPRELAVGACAGLCLLSLGLVAAVALDPTYQRADWRAAARAVPEPDGDRLIVLDDDFGGWFARLPFRLYLPSAHAVDDGLGTLPRRFPERLRRRPEDHETPSALVVRELVFVNVDGSSTCNVGARRILGVFDLDRDVDVDTIRVLSYRAATPQPVSPRQLAACMGDREVAILAQRS
jgi:mannosyltransferase